MADVELIQKEPLLETNLEKNPEPTQLTEHAVEIDNDVAPPARKEALCTHSRLEALDEKMKPIKEQLQYLLHKADEFEAQLMCSRDRLQNEGFAHVVPAFLHTCQPYFTYLESTARNSAPGHTPLPRYIRTRLLQFSQQLCSRLEHLLIMYASFGCISLEEADPLCISHFNIGQCQIDNIRMSIFRYCVPSPFLASMDSGLYKSMRWNVERKISPKRGTGEAEKKEREIGGTQQTEVEENEENKEGMLEGEQYNSTEYFFLCCEDVPVVDGRGHSVKEKTDKRTEDRVVKRMWFVGQWVQTSPNPDTEDIYEWILCTIPKGQYRKLACLGEEEPSTCIATDCLLGVLLSRQQ
ncbi:UPF0575 protein C19orf67 homolog isoform X1 [Hoplias malabaricus]|uniref:UPF0575 protein C19orf67 homolog isoform X1 n=1 Tax=Hoplias malabaricus TaxID=27720 RepID=UPI0034625660